MIVFSHVQSSFQGRLYCLKQTKEKKKFIKGLKTKTGSCIKQFSTSVPIPSHDFICPCNSRIPLDLYTAILHCPFPQSLRQAIAVAHAHKIWEMSQEIILAIGKQSYPDLREGEKKRQKKKKKRIAPPRVEYQRCWLFKNQGKLFQNWHLQKIRRWSLLRPLQHVPTSAFNFISL